MASRAKTYNRPQRDNDSLEALKPVVVLVLFGTILYGAYSVVQKGPAPAADSTTDAPPAAGEAPVFAPPPVPLVAAPPASEVPPPPQAQPPFQEPAAVVSAPLPDTATVPPPAPPGPPPAEVGPANGIAADVPRAAPAAPPPFPPVSAPSAAGIEVAGAAVAASAVAAAAVAAPTYLDAQSAPPPSTESLEPAAAGPRADRFATLSTTTPPPSMPRAAPGIPAAVTSRSSAAFATAWADAHDKLTAARYAEALAALSVWYDDPSLGLEESQKLEDLLGQLAGTVVFSQQDLLMPPHVVAGGETLAAIAAPLGVSPRLLAKINGVADPQVLVPGEHLKLVRGPFDAVVSISRRRLSLQLNGSYAGSFPVVVGRQFLGRVGGAIPVADVRPGAEPQAKPAIILGEGLVIEAAEDPGVVSDNAPDTSLVVSVRDLHELLDILGPGSRILVRQ